MVLKAEREIARLCGLYESGTSFDGAVVFRIERVGVGEGAVADVPVQSMPVKADYAVAATGKVDSSDRV